jgi:lipoprotein-anchoring transpeptidase ErfK/SrfK
MRPGRVFVIAVAAAALVSAAPAGAAEWTSDVRAPAFLVARPKAPRIPVFGRPNGQRPIGSVGAVTIFGSRRILAVVDVRAGWIGVTTEAVRNGRVAWIPARWLSLRSVRSSVDVDLSEHRLRLYRSGRLLRTIKIGIGRPDTRTPPGRYAITDKLPGAWFGSAYGCCILALSGHQPNPPASWGRGKDWRLAIHGGGGIGRAISAGCLHASDRDLRVLMRMLPVGAQVFVHA